MQIELAFKRDQYRVKVEHITVSAEEVAALEHEYADDIATLAATQRENLLELSQQ